MRIITNRASEMLTAAAGLSTLFGTGYAHAATVIERPAPQAEENNTTFEQRLAQNILTEQPAVAPQRQEQQRQERSARGIESFLNATTNSDFNTNTFGRVSFMRVEPIEREDNFTVADERLQQRLVELCDHLRSRY